MTNNGKHPFVQLREAALERKIFGYGGQPARTDMSLPANRERKARALIETGIAIGIVSSKGTFDDRKTIALALDRDSCRSITLAASRIRWPGAAHEPQQQRYANRQLSPEERVEQARRHGSHGFKGDPKAELDGKSYYVDPDSADEVLSLARSVGLKGFANSDVGSDEHLSLNDRNDSASEDVAITLARKVGLACVK